MYVVTYVILGGAQTNNTQLLIIITYPRGDIGMLSYLRVQLMYSSLARQA